MLILYVSVAPFVGAWIEITQEGVITTSSGVAPFVGAWIEILKIGDKINLLSVAPFVGAWIEILTISIRSWRKESLPSWERGLKFKSATFGLSVSPVAPFVGAWIEIVIYFHLPSPSIVAPFVGAWIEIIVDRTLEDVKKGRSLRGSVD